MAEQLYIENTGKYGEVLTEDWAHTCIVRPNWQLDRLERTKHLCRQILVNSFKYLVPR